MNGSFPLLDLFSSLRYKCILDGQRNQSFCIRKLDWCLQQAFMKACVSGSGSNLQGKIRCGLVHLIHKYSIMFSLVLLLLLLKEVLIVQIYENKLLHPSKTPLVWHSSPPNYCDLHHIWILIVVLLCFKLISLLLWQDQMFLIMEQDLPEDYR